jgi:hypothetical protein
MPWRPPLRRPVPHITQVQLGVRRWLRLHTSTLAHPAADCVLFTPAGLFMLGRCTSQAAYTRMVPNHVGAEGVAAVLVAWVRILRHGL